MIEVNKVAELEQVARRARARVDATLKSSVERELLAGEPMMMGFSRVDHHVSPTLGLTAQQSDEALAASLWGMAGDDQARRFAERLASLQAS